MKKELDEKLCNNYPEIFRDRHESMYKTNMCWGFECDDGWYPLIDNLCRNLMIDVINRKTQIEHIKEMIDRGWDKQSNTSQNYYSEENIKKLQKELEEEIKKIPIATQVKEKFGGLCFYIVGGTEKDFIKIDFAEQLSYNICEICSSMKAITYTCGWCKTLCDKHADEFYGKDIAEKYRQSKIEKEQ